MSTSSKGFIFLPSSNFRLSMFCDYIAELSLGELEDLMQSDMANTAKLDRRCKILISDEITTRATQRIS